MIVRSIPDMGTQQAELMSGGIHWMYNVKKDVGESMAKNDRINYQLGPSLRIGFFSVGRSWFHWRRSSNYRCKSSKSSKPCN